MELLTAYSDLGKTVKEAKVAGNAKLSNYYPNPGLHSEWISKKELWKLEAKNTTLLVHRRKAYTEILFFSRDSDCLNESLKMLEGKVDHPIMLEVISKLETNSGVLPVTATLKRMARTGYPTPGYIPENVICADVAYADAVADIFSDNFHPALERIPESKELRDLLTNGNIFIYQYNEEIAGFIIFEVMGSSIHLRYWWVSPAYRNQGVGSALMSVFFKYGKDTLRQYLWVFEGNENAIKRYKHYGFEFDGMYDRITYIE